MEDHERAYIQFTTHAVTIIKHQPGDIRCFKFTDTRCDYQTFAQEEDAVEWILEPFPLGTWEVRSDADPSRPLCEEE